MGEAVWLRLFGFRIPFGSGGTGIFSCGDGYKPFGWRLAPGGSLGFGMLGVLVDRSRACAFANCCDAYLETAIAGIVPLVTWETPSREGARAIAGAVLCFSLSYAQPGGGACCLGKPYIPAWELDR